ncbi:hypothetical protein BYT27DRAFT_7094783 [Phlegmacium glaucopus]|nr:hypothetical protein BYT27DRAFT_7094783 [Phlegmacium glaucopus]
MQYTLILNLWDQYRAAPLEINVEPGYSGPTPFAQRPPVKFTSLNAVLFGLLSRGRTHGSRLRKDQATTSLRLGTINAGHTDTLQRNSMDPAAFGYVQILKNAYKTKFLNAMDEADAHEAFEVINIK